MFDSLKINDELVKTISTNMENILVMVKNGDLSTPALQKITEAIDKWAHSKVTLSDDAKQKIQEAYVFRYQYQSEIVHLLGAHFRSNTEPPELDLSKDPEFKLHLSKVLDALKEVPLNSEKEKDWLANGLRSYVRLRLGDTSASEEDFRDIVHQRILDAVDPMAGMMALISHIRERAKEHA